MFGWLRGAKAPNESGGAVDRSYDPQGPWTPAFRSWVAREVEPRLYEALRESVPLIDAVVNRLVALDGILRFEADSDAMLRELEEWAEGVAVNDLQTGLQSFYTISSNELYEQGFLVGEWVAGNRDVVRLNVADSKGVHFHRPRSGPLEIWYRPPPRQGGRRDGTDNVERVLRNQYTTSTVGDSEWLREQQFRALDPRRIVYGSFNAEADNPYGVSLLRSMEFIGKAILTIENATLLTWERFGDPVFNVLYKTKHPRTDEATLERRRTTLAQSLADAIKAKRQGKAVDVVNAIGKDDELTVQVLGADGQVLELEAPVRHLEEQIVGRSGLPAWLVGRHWSTAERLAQRQGEVVLQESRTRFELRKPGLRRIVAAMLRARGRTWNARDWDIVQELPSLQDLEAKARAELMEAQAEAVREGRDQNPAPQGGGEAGRALEIRAVRGVRNKQADGGEAWAEKDPELPDLERATINALTREWWRAFDTLRELLGLPAPEGKAAKQDEGVFIFDAASMEGALRELEREFVAAVGGQDASLASAIYRAWLRGVANGADEVDADAIEQAEREAQRRIAATRSLDLVRNVSVRAIRDDVAADLAEGVYDGLNPRDVARRLAERFEVHEYDWERLARSEITQAHAVGKQDQYRANAVERYDYVTANDSRVSSICRNHQAQGPYMLGAGPIPMRDSHPNCRCTIRARAD